ncbi:MAG: hypothetical protein DRH51_00875 [Candidatus Coatesbacteria bacterium]|nr:MAG: hypothetical protein DRH49_07460 [Candidatus Coatesbacteria bacterium]RLC42368.1 MAG: hypothetical protein DRH51_00875 [Candidatus Coatesbacteria bacterium]HEC80169.1 hypothetical protein [Bacillota bacterium]
MSHSEGGATVIETITGTVLGVSESSVMIDIGFVNLGVLIPPFYQERMAECIGSEITLYTHLSTTISSNKLNISLMGFVDKADRALFRSLTQVPGIGDRAALAVMQKPTNELIDAINTGRVDVLNSLPGVGVKKARQIITTLAGKIVTEEVERAPKGGIWDDARKALSALGLSTREVEQALIRLRDTIGTPETVEDVIKHIYQERS